MGSEPITISASVFDLQFCVLDGAKPVEIKHSSDLPDNTLNENFNYTKTIQSGGVRK